MRVRTLLVVFVALLAVSAMPVSAQNASAVASQHTTFGTGSQGEPSPDTLTNMSVTGSGESASVTLDTDVNESFEDGDIAEYGGDTGAYSISDSVSYNGSKSLTGSTGSVSYISDTDRRVAQGGNISARLRTDNTQWRSGVVIGTQNETNDPGGYQIDLNWGGSNVILYRGTGGDRTQLAETSVSLGADNWYRVDIGWATDGTITITLFDESGSQIAQISATDTAFSSGGIGWYHKDGNNNARFHFDDLVADGGTASNGTYVGAAHDAEAVEHGWTDLTIQNASADVTWQEDSDGDGQWANVTSATYSSSGNVTADLSGTQSDRWRVRVDVEPTGSDPTFALDDEGLLFTANTPALSNEDPTGEITTYDGDISVNISDADLGLAQGDSVTVNATDSSGNQIGSQTVSSNQTVTFSYDALAGQNEIAWTATDSYGNSTSLTQTFSTPGVLKVRNESDPDQLVNTSSNITATFFGDDGETVVERSSDDGTFNLSGLPADTELVVSVDANGYRSRQVIITSLFDQQNVYLLPDSATAATIEFELNDQTGRFESAGTVLFVEMPLTVNNSTDYRTVFADEFGATDTRRVTLRDNTRYRIKVRNDEGEVRVLESYTTSGDAIATLTIGQVEVSGEIGDRGVAFTATVIEADTKSGRALRIVYRDPEQLTSEIEVGVEYNGSKYVSNITGTSGYGRFITTVPIDNSTPANATFNVTYSALRDGTTITGATKAGAVGDLDIPIADLPLSLLGWMLTLGLTSMVIIRTPRLAPATGTATASMLTIVGVLGIPAPALGISGAISVLAVVGRGGGQ